MLKLDLASPEGRSPILPRLGKAYERIAGSDDYQKNQRSLRLIQGCVITISAAATGYVNAFAHKQRLGWLGAGLLALLVAGFVEKFYFTLRHGLATIYKSRRQRLIASLCYRAIQTSMALNAAILCAWVGGTPLPAGLEFWSRWSIVLQFMLALLGVSAVRDSDAVIKDRVRQLKSEAARDDILSIRRATAEDNPLLLLAAKLRGFLDGLSLALRLLRDKSDVSPNYVNRVQENRENLLSAGQGEDLFPAEDDASNPVSSLGKP
jgi:hypothetical protein